jgi:hypothetical protein
MRFPLGSVVLTLERKPRDCVVGARAPLRGEWSTLGPPAQGHVRGHADVRVLLILVLVSCRPRPRMLGLPPDRSCCRPAPPCACWASAWKTLSDIQTTTRYTRLTQERNSRFLRARSGPTKENPVMLPPGRARLAANPEPIGSPTPMNTIGNVVVAFLAATVAGVPKVTITAGWTFSNFRARGV